jgi:spore germination cell wall hydrolase CwlJ-like protein
LRPRKHQALRRRPKGRAASFAIAVVVLTMPPAQIGYQDVAAALIAGQPAAGESLRAHLIASPFGTIHAATFSFPQPVGTGIPAISGLRIAAYTPTSDVTGAPARAPPNIDLFPSSRDFPEIDRGLKGPRLVPRVRPDFDSAQPSTIEGLSLSSGLQPAGAPTAGTTDEATPDRSERTNPNPAPDDADLTYLDPSAPETAEPWLVDSDGARVRAARLYFGTASLGGTPATIEPWGPGQAPIFEPQEPETAILEPNEAAPFESPRNETIAPKGEVTGKERRPKSPAERLGLIGPARAKQEKCLADAIYFEARGESVRGQMAVAQVVINRVFSGYYPNNVCGVVYQNAHRHLRCQFTFACDGLPGRINEPAAWERAKHIARDALDGNFWLNDVGKATHYHARWVHPWWVREMRKLDRIGVHTFYRPRNWGDGSNSPTWGDAEATTTAAKTL